MLRDEIDRLVGRINGDLGRIGRPAISYLHSSYPREEMAALYRAADIMVVTPYRDGMNLVAKEYVACRYDDDGALVLSEFAGAADELRQAWLVNPYDINGMKSALLEAYQADEKELTRRMKAMRKTVTQQRRRRLGGQLHGRAVRRRASTHGKTVKAGPPAPEPPARESARLRLGPGDLRRHQGGDLLAAARADHAPARLVAVDLAQRPGAADAVDHVDVVGADQRRVDDADGLGDLEQVAAQRPDVVGEPDALQRRVEPRVSAGSGWRRRSGSGRCGTSAPGCSRSRASPRGRR